MNHSPTQLGERRKLYALAALAIALTLATGAVYGRWTQRWGAPPLLEEAAQRVAAFPRQFGDWQLLEDQPMAKAIEETLQCAAYVNRVYSNVKTGARVSVALIVGPPGPIAVHTPEICYSSQAFEIVDSRRQELFDAADGAPHSLWLTTFKSRNAGAQHLLVYYGWSTGERWTASSSPRYEFGGERRLYKIQLATVTESALTDDSTSPIREFVAAFLKEYWQAPTGGAAR